MDEVQNAKEQFTEFLAKVYSEGYEAGMQAGLEGTSTVLEKLSGTIKTDVDTSKAKENAFNRFIEFFDKIMDDAIKDNVIEFKKKS